MASLIDLLSLSQQLELIYIGYFNRAADGGGYTFWADQNSKAQAHGQSAATALTNIANSFTPQPETLALYPFLSNTGHLDPTNPVTQAGVTSLIYNVYENLFDRAPDADGGAYWSHQILTGAVPLGAAILAIANGATGNDLLLLENKTTVALDFTSSTQTAGLDASSSLPASYSYNAELYGVLLGVTADPASVTAAEASITAWIAGASGQNVLAAIDLNGSNITDPSVAHYSNVNPAFFVTYEGVNNYKGGVQLTHSQAFGDSLVLGFNAATGGSLALGTVTSTGDTTVSIVSNGTAAATNYVFQLNETDNHLTTVAISGSAQFFLGDYILYSGAGVPNSDEGVVTDSAIAAAGAATTTASSLTLIDASTTTGGVLIYAGASNVAGGGSYSNGGTLSANNTITYTGLTIKGGSGQDLIENDANNGVVTDGNFNGDAIYLGGSGASATFGTGADDEGFVGNSHLVTNTAGSALGDTFTFGAGATAKLHIGVGAEAGSTAGTLSIGQTAVNGAAAGMTLDFAQVTTAGAVVNENSAVASATSLTNAENAAAHALGSAGVAYFNYGGNEYVIAIHAAETAVSNADAVVELVGITNHGMTNTAGVVTLA